MFGKLLGNAVRIATSPIDVANIFADTVTSGDGSKRSRTNDEDDIILGSVEKMRDRFAEAFEDMDDD
jgi:hypothetical protein